MALRGKKPEAVVKRLKLFLFGPPGSGKTTAALQFPKPYFIDTEKGAENEQYVKMMEKQGAAYFGTTDADDVITEVTALLTTKHDYRTLVIDPLTVIYNDLIEKGMLEKGEEFGRYKIPADRKIKHLLNLLMRLDMNIIITSHAKDRWVRGKDSKGKDTAVQDGITFDCYSKLDYLFDLVLRIEKGTKGRTGVVVKTRIETFPEGDVFPFNYDTIADKYGRTLLEAQSVPESLATPEQIEELTRLVKVLSIPPETVDKWLTKAKAESLEEMPSDVAGKCIDYCKGLVTTRRVEEVAQ